MNMEITSYKASSADSTEIKWSDEIFITEIYHSKKAQKRVTRKKLVTMIINQCDQIEEETILLLKIIVKQQLSINYYFPNYSEKTKVELVIGDNKISFVPTKGLKDSLDALLL